MAFLLRRPLLLSISAILSSETSCSSLFIVLASLHTVVSKQLCTSRTKKHHHHLPSHHTIPIYLHTSLFTYHKYLVSLEYKYRVFNQIQLQLTQTLVRDQTTTRECAVRCYWSWCVEVKGVRLLHRLQFFCITGITNDTKLNNILTINCAYLTFLCVFCSE